MGFWVWLVGFFSIKESPGRGPYGEEGASRDAAGRDTGCPGAAGRDTPARPRGGADNGMPAGGAR